MSSPEFKTDKVCFVDPATDRVRTYAQFAEDVACHPDGDDLDPAYESICLIVSHIIRGNDVGIEQDQIRTTAKNLKSDISHSEDWLQAIRNSKSQIRILTSGTTGTPKHIVHSVGSLTRGVRTGKHHRQDIWGLAYPINHLAGLQVLFQALFNQNTIVQLFGQPTELVHQAIEQHSVTHLSCTPTFLKMLDANDQFHTKVKRLTTGGERCDESTLAVIGRLFPTARHRNIYALTEVGNLLIAEGDLFSVPAELQTKVKVIDGCLAIHRSLLADRTIAECSDSTELQADDRPGLLEDFFLTGDLVDVLSDEPLTFKFSARRDDVINVGGYKVMPQQVEDCLIESPEIHQVVVYGKKNSVTGQIVVCDVVLEPGSQLDITETRQRLAEVLPRYAVPRIFNIVESLRMTESGKLCRRNEES